VQEPVIVRQATGNIAPVVFDSPHSGTHYPEDFEYAVPLATMRRGEDAFIDDIFSAAPDQGAVLIEATFARMYIDPNRAATDLDPASIDGAWDGPIEMMDKARGGAGLIRTVSVDGTTQLYGRKLTPAEIRHRIDTSITPPSHQRSYALGDRDGTTASAEFTELVRETLSGLGYRVAVNDGQKGVELVRAYSDPAKNRHSLQIEINRRLYMDEDKIRKSDGYANQQAAMTKLIEVVCAYARDQVS
jgi:N-formylglutamate amidohydrolase